MDRVKGMANAARQKVLQFVEGRVDIWLTKILQLQKSDPNEGSNEEPEQLRTDHQVRTWFISWQQN